MSTNNAYIITPSSITLFTDKPRTFDRSAIADKVMDQVVEALNDDDFDRAVKLLDPTKAIQDFFAAEGAVQVKDGVVWYHAQPIDNYATRKALEFARQGLPVQPLLRFIDKVMKNPSYRAVQELYSFLEHGQLPLTTDGDFLAYKKVRKDPESGEIVDIFTGKFSNNPGAVCEMPRNMVDEDPDRTCSNGLHVCSHEYLPHFGCGGDNAIVTVQVNPADVVAVPKDYNDTKMRVCRYVVLDVLEEYEPRKQGNLFADTYLYDPDEDEGEDDDLDFSWDEDGDEDLDDLIPPYDPQGWQINDGTMPIWPHVDLILRIGSIHHNEIVDDWDWTLTDSDDPSEVIWWRPAS